MVVGGVGTDGVGKISNDVGFQDCRLGQDGNREY